MTIQLIFNQEWHKKLLPIQSFRQLFDSVVISLAIGFFSTKVFFLWPEGFVITTVFAWVGTFPVMTFLLPATLLIETNSSKMVLGNVENILHSEYYKKAIMLTIDDLRFEVKLPRFLRWKESDVNVAINRERVTIDGPILVLRIIKKRLEASTSL